jgi:hypothetical protein
MTQLSPMNSWKSMGPCVVSALKLGAVLPRRRVSLDILCSVLPRQICANIANTRGGGVAFELQTSSQRAETLHEM